jgi:hypothetical protein
MSAAAGTIGRCAGLLLPERGGSNELAQHATNGGPRDSGCRRVEGGSFPYREARSLPNGLHRVAIMPPVDIPSDNPAVISVAHLGWLGALASVCGGSAPSA